MLPGKPFTCSHRLKAIIAGCCIMVALNSCKVPVFVKKYPAGKPFVYETNINLTSDLPREQKTSLTNSLEAQLDDSIRTRRLDKFFWKVMKNPPLYDRANADKSIIYMRALLTSLGYFGDSIGYRADTVIRKNQYRTTVTFDVSPGKLWRFDSISYNIKHPELQRLADVTRNQAYIKKGDPFAKIPISAELDRLTELYRNNGYLRFSRDELVGVWDTLDASLLQPSFDPFEQLRLLEQLRERRSNPTVDLELRLRNGDTSRLTKYYNGTVTVYPDYTIDTSDLNRKETMVKGIKVIQYRNLFKSKIFPPNIYLPRDSVYSQRRYIRTINRFNLMGSWQLVNIEQVPRKGQDTVDYIIRLTPAKKWLFSSQIEGSFNQNSISGNLFGIGVNVGLQDKNFLKGANLANLNARYGIEFGNSGSNQFIQTQQASLSSSVYFPRAILFDKWVPETRKDNIRTLLSFSVANTDRRLLYNLTTINASWGYEYQRRNLLFTLRFPNIEYSFLNKRDSLDSLIRKNPSLNNIFTDGLIFSAVGNLTLTNGVTRKNLTVFRANFEGAPLMAGWIKSPFLDSQLYNFVKIDAELARLIRNKKSSIALRFFAGVGLADPFNGMANGKKQNALPFFKQYFSGGPNSMRAWALRRLGQGSTIKEYLSTPDRYGDVQLEANVEYRFPLFKVVGVPVNGAVFTDIGNIWFLKKKAGAPEEVFKFGRLGEDIAIGAGTGIRVDFGFFVIRLDYSYKVKDPSPSPENAAIQNKWFGYKFFKGDQFQLGIGYPFIF